MTKEFIFPVATIEWRWFMGRTTFSLIVGSAENELTFAYTHSFQIQWIMIVLTVFLSILNQTEFRLAQIETKENQRKTDFHSF